jgi:hypothetical protein
VALPNVKLDIASGQCRSQDDVYDMTLSSSITIDSGVVGVNGLDTGVLVASSLYNVFLISDPVTLLPVAGLLSLSLTPIMPFGYSALRLIGYMATDSGVHFLKGYMSGNNNAKIWTYDAPQASPVTAGASATYAPVVLTGLVPAIDNLPVMIQTDYTANAAADVLGLQGANSTGDAVKIIAPVAGATAHTVNNSQVLSQLLIGIPNINYKVSAGAVAVNVCGYNLYI